MGDIEEANRDLVVYYRSRIAELEAERDRLRAELERIAGIKLETRKGIIARAALRQEGSDGRDR